MNGKKMAVVTAGSRGIGRAVVLKLASEGFDILTCSRSREKLDALKSEVAEVAPSCRLQYVPADLSEKAGVASFLDLVTDHQGAIEVLVNNAGAFIPGKVSDEPEGALESMIDINLYSAYRVTRGILPRMIENKRGHIFNMCSVASIVPYMHGGSYCIAKFALLGFSKVLREEMKDQGIRVTAILPGAALSDSWAGVDLSPERFMPVEDVATCIFEAYSLSERTVVEELLIRPQLGDI